jgi:hypothetical protein
VVSNELVEELIESLLEWRGGMTTTESPSDVVEHERVIGGERRRVEAVVWETIFGIEELESLIERVVIRRVQSHHGRGGESANGTESKEYSNVISVTSVVTAVAAAAIVNVIKNRVI